MIVSRVLRLIRFSVYRELSRLETRQSDVLHALEDDLIQSKLESLRQMRDLVLGWRVSIEKPEVDIRDDLDAMYRDLSDQVARIEEHIL